MKKVLLLNQLGSIVVHVRTHQQEGLQQKLEETNESVLFLV
jgi:hypothetical protein